MTDRHIEFRTPIYLNGNFSHFYFWGQLDADGKHCDDCFLPPLNANQSYYEHKPHEPYIHTLKNGVKIYQNDLVIVKRKKMGARPYIDLVSWNGIQGYRLKHYRGQHPAEKSFLSIVDKYGSIHTHPELVTFKSTKLVGLITDIK